MIKFCALMDSGMLYGFGLTEANLNRMEFNKESIFFSFDYAGHPEIWALLLFLEEYGKAEEIIDGLQDVSLLGEQFLDEARGVTPDTLRIFPFGREVMDKLRRMDYWAFGASVEIKHPDDQQLFFAGPDEKAIKRYMYGLGLR